MYTQGRVESQLRWKLSPFRIFEIEDNDARFPMVWDVQVGLQQIGGYLFKQGFSRRH